MTEPGLAGLGTPVPVAGPVPGGYAELRRRVRQEGLLDRRPRYYAIKIAVMAALLAAGWAAFFVLADSWYQLLVAVYLAAVFGQIGFLGHEAGHRQIFRSRRGNELVGLVHGNLLIGMSFGWWIGQAQPAPRLSQHAGQGSGHHHSGAGFHRGPGPRRAAGWPGCWPVTRHTCSSPCCCSKG